MLLKERLPSYSFMEIKHLSNFQTDTSSLDMAIFLRKIVEQGGGRKAELSIGADQLVPPAELSSLTAKDFTDLGPEGNPGESPS